MLGSPADSVARELDEVAMRETVNRLLGRSARPPVAPSGTQVGGAGDEGPAVRAVPEPQAGKHRAWQRALRQVAGAPLGWVLTAAGAALLVVGWYGISGESVVAKQLPYLASATIPGAALLVSGLLMTTRAQPDERERQLLADLHSALLEPAPPAPAAESDGLWATSNGHTYHRAGCTLAQRGAAPVTQAQVRERGLQPCPVCEPPTVE
jgi:hypothetical protein